MCWVGCLANKICCIAILILNIGLIIGYFFGLLFECKSECYKDNGDNDGSYYLQSIIGPSLMFMFGCILAVLTLQRANKNFYGCHNIIIVLWLLSLLTTLVFCGWNAYNMIYNDLGVNTTIYHDMVYAVCIWNILLMLISCNIMIRDDASDYDGLKRSSSKKTNYKTVEEQAFDHRNKTNNSDFHQL